MKLRFHGPELPAGVIASIGTFEPWISHHDRLTKRLCTVARKQNLVPCVIMLDPSPSSFQWPPHEWPVLHDLGARMKILNSHGVLHVLVPVFGRKDLDCGAEEFLQKVVEVLPLKRVLIGSRQSFGPGEVGGVAAFKSAAQRLGVAVDLLPAVFTRNKGNAARALFREGKVTESIKILGRPAYITRPARSPFPIAWPAGTYLASPGLRTNLEITENAESYSFDVFSSTDGPNFASWRPEFCEVISVYGKERAESLS